MRAEQLRTEILQRLGYRPLSRGWAKLEILLGLTAAGAGLFLFQQARTDVSDGRLWAGPAGLILFVLGGYLTLAGHRSHLYQSANDQLLLLIEELRKTLKGNP